MNRTGIVTVWLKALSHLYNDEKDRWVYYHSDRIEWAYNHPLTTFQRDNIALHFNDFLCYNIDEGCLQGWGINLNTTMRDTLNWFNIPLCVGYGWQSFHSEQFDYKYVLRLQNVPGF